MPLPEFDPQDELNFQRWHFGQVCMGLKGKAYQNHEGYLRENWQELIENLKILNWVIKSIALIKTVVIAWGAWL